MVRLAYLAGMIPSYWEEPAISPEFQTAWDAAVHQHS